MCVDCMCVAPEEQMTADATRVQQVARRAAEIANKQKKFQDDTAAMVQRILAEKKPA